MSDTRPDAPETRSAAAGDDSRSQSSSYATASTGNQFWPPDNPDYPATLIKYATGLQKMDEKSLRCGQCQSQFAYLRSDVWYRCGKTLAFTDCFVVLRRDRIHFKSEPDLDHLHEGRMADGEEKYVMLCNNCGPASPLGYWVTKIGSVEDKASLLLIKLNNIFFSDLKNPSATRLSPRDWSIEDVPEEAVRFFGVPIDSESAEASDSVARLPCPAGRTPRFTIALNPQPNRGRANYRTGGRRTTGYASAGIIGNADGSLPDDAPPPRELVASIDKAVRASRQTFGIESVAGSDAPNDESDAPPAAQPIERLPIPDEYGSEVSTDRHELPSNGEIGPYGQPSPSYFPSSEESGSKAQLRARVKELEEELRQTDETNSKIHRGAHRLLREKNRLQGTIDEMNISLTEITAEVTFLEAERTRLLQENEQLRSLLEARSPEPQNNQQPQASAPKRSNSKRNRRRKRANDADDDTSEYEVDRIIDYRRNADGQEEYKATYVGNWAAWNANPSWQPASDFSNAEELINAFHASHPEARNAHNNVPAAPNRPTIKARRTKQPRLNF
ncbi:hypothetical protein KEM56_000732 [Ascosphaera pollenicola]|nr:hypothetical protein KEM56_000732 [Ascosphaera pollenicola]